MPPKTIYIAGPMRGYPRYNFDAFHQAERQLRECGWDPLSPARADLSSGFDPTQNHQFTQQDVVDFIRRDIEMICRADAIALLPGWERSVGARAEVAVARWKGIPIYEYSRGVTWMRKIKPELVVCSYAQPVNKVVDFPNVTDQEIRVEAEKRYGKPHYGVGDSRYDRERAVVFMEGANYVQKRNSH